MTDLDAHEIQSVDTDPEPLNVSGQLITAGDIGTLKSNSKWLVPGHIFIVTVTVSVSLQQFSHVNVFRNTIATSGYVHVVVNTTCEACLSTWTLSISG